MAEKSHHQERYSDPRVLAVAGSDHTAVRMVQYPIPSRVDLSSLPGASAGNHLSIVSVNERRVPPVRASIVVGGVAIHPRYGVGFLERCTARGGEGGGRDRRERGGGKNESKVEPDKSLCW